MILQLIEAKIDKKIDSYRIYSELGSKGFNVTVKKQVSGKVYSSSLYFLDGDDLQTLDVRLIEFLKQFADEVQHQQTQQTQNKENNNGIQ